MRRALALLLSSSLGTSPLFAAYNDYSDNNRNDYAYGVSANQFQNNWNTRNDWSRNLNTNVSVVMRPPVQPPSYNFDLSFSNNFSFNSSNFNFNSYSKLDLNYNNSFTTPAFTAKPVIQNFNFQASNLSSFSSFNSNRSFDAGRSSIQSFQPDSFSNQSIRNQDFTLPDTFSRAPSNDFNSRTLQPAVFKSPASEVFRTALTSPLRLPQTAPAAVSVVRSALSNLLSMPNIQKTFAVATKAQPAASLQVRAQTGLFEGVAAVVKSIPAFFASVGAKIKDAAVGVWNRVVLGHRTEKTVSMADGSTLTGKITVNRKDEVVAVAPGTVRTVGQVVQDQQGQSTLVPASKAVTVNGEDYLRGDFVFDGEKFNLDGAGLKVTTQAGPTIQGTEKVKQYVHGDGKGGETSLGFGALSKSDSFQETTTGMSFRNNNGVWSMDPGQSGTLKLDGKAISVAIDDGGHFSAPVKAPALGQGAALALVTGVLPNPETSGYQVLGMVKLNEGDTFKATVTGSKPSQYLPGQINGWRQQTSAHVKEAGFPPNTATVATVHQEGDQYVFTSGHASFAAITGPDLKGDGSAQGQKTLYTEAVLGGSSHLTVTGPTDFPPYGTKVIAGAVDIYAVDSMRDTRMEIKPGTLYQNNSQGLRLVLKNDGVTASIPVKDVDLKAGNFVAVIPDIRQEKSGEYVATGGREVRGKIDFDNGRAFLVDTSFKAPLYGPNKVLGVVASDDLRGAGWITLRDNELTTKLDRSGVELDAWRTADARPSYDKPVLQAYRTAVSIYQEEGNPIWARGSAFAISSIMGPAIIAEETIDFLRGTPAAVKETAHYAGLVTIDAKNRQWGDAALNTLCTVAVGADATLRVIGVADLSFQTGKVLVAEVSSLTQSARSLAGRISAEVGGFTRPVLNESGAVLIPGTTAPKSTIAITTPREVAMQSASESALAARTAVEQGAPLYRGGNLGKSNTGPSSQFWSLEHPSSPGYVQRYGIPEKNMNFDFIETSKLKPGAQFITREAPGSGINGGGAIEVVVEENGVASQAFSTLRKQQ